MACRENGSAILVLYPATCCPRIASWAVGLWLVWLAPLTNQPTTEGSVLSLRFHPRFCTALFVLARRWIRALVQAILNKPCPDGRRRRVCACALTECSAGDPIMAEKKAEHDPEMCRCT